MLSGVIKWFFSVNLFMLTEKQGSNYSADVTELLKTIKEAAMIREGGGEGVRHGLQTCQARQHMSRDDGVHVIVRISKAD